MRWMRAAMAAGVVLVCGLAAGAGVATTASAAPIPEPSPVLLDDNATWRFDETCNYYLTMWTNAGGELNRTTWVWAPPGKSLRIAVQVGVQDSYDTCAEIVANQDAGGSYMRGQEVLLDLEGDGTFERVTAHTEWFLTPRFERRTEPYLITSIWEAPNGNRIVNQMAVYVGTMSGISVNGGQEYTNSRDVTIDVTPEPGARYLALSNDGGFANARILDVASEVPWQLRADREGQFTRVVYVRFLDGNGRVMSTLSDDIILDTAPPTIESAVLVSARAGGPAVRRAPLTVRVRASDNRSGVERLQVSSTRSGRDAIAVAYLRRVTIDRPEGGARFIRVRDGAGNWSEWKRLT